MITKEQWEEIERLLRGPFGQVKFKLNEQEIALEKRFIKENVLIICVFIDGEMRQSMGWPGDDYDPTVELIWNKRSHSVYPAKSKERLTKLYGKRRVKKEIKDLDKKIEWYEPFFKTFASVQRKYKKIEGLEFIDTVM